MPIPRPAYSYRDDPAVPAFPDDKPVFVFDGDCAFCSASARLILKRDRTGAIRLLAAQTELGRALYIHYGLDPDIYETSVLISNGTASTHLDGVIAMANHLGMPWSLMRGLFLLPKRLRDVAYILFARNRFRLFGRTARCYLMEKGFEDRFLGQSNGGRVLTATLPAMPIDP